MSDQNLLPESGTIDLNNQPNIPNLTAEPIEHVEPVIQVEPAVEYTNSEFIPPKAIYVDHNSIPPEDNDTFETGRISSRGLAIGAIIAGILIISAGYVAYRYFSPDDSPQTGTAPVAEVQIDGEDERADDANGQIASGVSTSRADVWEQPGDSFGIVQFKPDDTSNTLAEVPEIVTQQPQVAGLEDERSNIVSSPAVSSGVQPANINSAWKANNYSSGDIKTGSYTVVRGDTLWEIAQGTYNNGGDWHKIADANHVQYLANGHPLILPGQVLTIPI